MASLVISNKNAGFTSAVFNPLHEYDQKGEAPLYKSDGTCCVSLSEYCYKGGSGTKADTKYQRTEYDYIKTHVEQGYFNMITTDNILDYQVLYANLNRRNTVKYYR